jgi:hypothetical protein
MRELVGIIVVLFGGMGFVASLIAEILDGWIQNLQAWPWSIILGVAALLLLIGLRLTFPEKTMK